MPLEAEKLGRICSEKKLRNMSLKWKLALIVGFVTLLSFGFYTSINVYSLKTNASNELEKELLSVGILTSLQLDAEKLDSLASQNGLDEPDFIDLQTQLDYIQEQQGTIAWSYVWQMADDGYVIPLVYSSNLNEIYSPSEPFNDLAEEHTETAEKNN